ncbi:MAG: NAD-dependent epimerase/dehydratase family protein [Candidatus Altiarchaeum hamiconexum]|uniref:NAD-dependent epimerase/dehydratase family protein n=1 Tax=Candidatus Altarchaeum hamiconexum TaxID=1803513 RepID=A0A8J7Z475_9ARCH|nr:NAD-dependent epimerase/dehydratase family protein [Candidatus Altarchaeum hamiconexum]OIQ04703.1 MAG: UDP-glucose 4-epimerase [Candidatus Altarchaeum sp. CG2_30_32_3053]PIN67225.1 MAG: UDP-glucose 4-epimerase [Candidatus Altarchaeum sp. CG12_big_fil_rev_8_21_14_0_65_33_22]PIV28336.1 MAG: UDP-glucose 4-epimerase [Candidatus Altarchaeum sp. CG03_land_8_20_14_0_80_32_618]PIX48734.1 MAG: UDP-glucose 4-epimerase [Candidatus Altarchaeum sp. CG_4_8_14_3_um_filter_33_2054]PIZ32623.1 MAG: UDP-gluco
MILVTGGAGFIGSNLVDELLNQGHNVKVLDNLTTGRLENLSNASKSSKFKFYKGDLREFDREILKDVEIIFHLAAQIDVRKSIENPVYDMDINIRGSINLIQQAINSNVEKIIYSSSGGAIYGEPTNLPADENTNIKPISPYGASKFAVEGYLNAFGKIYGLKYTAMRYGNVYGRRQDPLGEAGVIAIFFGRASDNKNPVIFGDGNQTRDYVSVDDVVRANIAAVDKLKKYQEYNVGTGKETSVRELVTFMEKIFSKKITPVYEKERPGEVKRIYLDIKRLNDEINFKPDDVETGMKKVYEWMKDR